MAQSSLGSPLQAPYEILISDATRITICYTEIAPAGKAVEHADVAKDGYYGRRHTESEASFIRDKRGDSNLKHAFCPRIACDRCVLDQNHMRSGSRV
jgi:hypothetical protein